MTSWREWIKTLGEVTYLDTGSVRIHFYDEWFTKQKKQKWATKISIVVCGIIVICIIGFLIGVLIGYI